MVTLATQKAAGTTATAGEKLNCRRPCCLTRNKKWENNYN